MKNIKLLKLATDYLRRHLKQSVAYVLVFAVSLFLVSLTLMLYQQTRSAYDLCDEILVGNISGTGRIRFNDEDVDSTVDFVEFLEALYSMPEIIAAGSCGISGWNLFGNLFEIQEDHAQNYAYTLDGLVEVIDMTPRLWNLCNVELSEGMPVGEIPIGSLAYQDDDGLPHFYSYIYLGDAYKGSVELGHKYTTTYTTYEVAGFIEKGSRWVNPDIISSFNLDSYSFDMDYSVVTIIPFMPTNAALFSTSGSMDNAQRLITDLAREYDLDVMVGTLEDLFDKSWEEYNVIIGYLSQLIGVVLFSALAIMVCMQTVAIYNSQRDYGILLSTGFLRSDIVKIIGYRTAITALLSLTLSGILVTLFTQRWFSGFPASYIRFILRERIFPAAGLVALAVALITLVISVVIFRKIGVVRLIRG